MFFCVSGSIVERRDGLIFELVFYSCVYDTNVYRFEPVNMLKLFRYFNKHIFVPQQSEFGQHNGSVVTTVAS